TNTATASGNGVTSPPASATVNAEPKPALSLTKTAAPATYDHVGQVITYTYTIKNTGNVTLAGPFSVTDDHILAGTPPVPTAFACGSGPLAPVATTSCTNTYTLTQANRDNGKVTNTATASG